MSPVYRGMYVYLARRVRYFTTRLPVESLVEIDFDTEKGISTLTMNNLPVNSLSLTMYVDYISTMII
jgi:hypothetical protein